MIQPPKIKTLVSKVAIYLLPFLILGFLFDLVKEAVILALALALAWQYYQLHKMVNWLWFKRDAYPPNAKGIWADVFDGIYHQRRKHRKKRNELSLLIRRFRLGAESLPDAAVVFNEDRTIVWCNQLAQSMLGFKLPEDIGNRLDNFLRQPEFLAFLESKQYDDPFEFKSPLDDKIILECRIAPFEKDKWTLITRDITQVKHMEQMRKDFIANVSHELRTPLTVMRGYLELFDELEVPELPMWSKAHRMMSEQTLRMNGLVDQLLTLTKLENKPTVVSPSLVDVPTLLTKIQQEAIALSEGRHKIKLDMNDTLWLKSNEDQLRSAFSNLIFNAVRYTPEHGEIEISWHQLPDGSAQFSCRDTGDGIPPEHLSRLTERFYRVDQARTRDSGGSGLGLSIVKHVLSNHDAELKIHSQLRVGSTFSFNIGNEFVEKNEYQSN